MRNRLRILGIVVTAFYAGCIAGMVLILDGWSVNRLFVSLYVLGRHHLRVPAAITPDHYAYAANLIMLAPLAGAALLVWQRLPWWIPALTLTLCSGAVELSQRFLLTTRDPNAGDFFLNSAGAILGALAGALVRKRAGGGPEPTARRSIEMLGS